MPRKPTLSGRKPKAETGKQDNVLVVPGSLTDIAKAIREVIGLVRDAAELVGEGSKLYNRRRSKVAAKSLSALAFTPEGSRRHLERIAAGHATKVDFAGIGKQMENTASSVEKSIRSLAYYRDRLREANGMAAANKLDEIIYGPAGKRMLRETLTNISTMGQQPEPPLDDIKAAAKQSLDIINELNQSLIELHDLVLNVRPN